jgi:hypothetical protein
MSYRQLFARYPAYRAEGMTPGETVCDSCGYHDILILNAEVTGDPPFPKVTMRCGGCSKRTTHEFTPSTEPPKRPPGYDE